MPEQLRPMLASAARLPAEARDSEGERWAYEVKWDGVRAIAYAQDARLRLESRTHNDISAQYPELQALREALRAHAAILDGEIVAFDAQGLPSFARLQTRMHLSSPRAIADRSHDVPVTYVIFDLLHLDGHSTIELPYRERRELLAGLKLDGPSWQTPGYHLGKGRELLAASAARGLEGIVAKRLDSPYRPGARGDDWLKIKNLARQEFVIGGSLPGKGRRAGQLGALLVGYYAQHDGEPVLRYAGRVGTGFDAPELERLARELQARARDSSPFAASPVELPREARFAEPELVAEVEFTQWTRDGLLRHSSYKGLREDKPAAEVQLETPRAAPASEGRTARARRTKRELPRAGPSDGSEGDRSRAESPDDGASAVRYRVLREQGPNTEIEAQGRTLRLSNRTKVLFPATRFTKGEVVDYYAAVAPVLLPHLARRPLTLKRYPNGVDAPYFYEKRCPAHRPAWVATAPVYTELEGEIDFCLVEDLPTLLWVANLASIELHTSLARAPEIETPTAIVFDLDPGAPAGLRECCRVALRVREVFAALQMQSLAKTSGAKGLQVYVPLNTDVPYERTRPYAHAVARLLERAHPKEVVSRSAKGLRTGKVLIDWSQNEAHKTTVCVYSLRALERPTVSTPLHWEEVEAAANSTRREPRLSAHPRALLQRVERHGDLFAALLEIKQPLRDPSGEFAGKDTT